MPTYLAHKLEDEVSAKAQSLRLDVFAYGIVLARANPGKFVAIYRPCLAFSETSVVVKVEPPKVFDDPLEALADAGTGDVLMFDGELVTTVRISDE